MNAAQLKDIHPDDVVLWLHVEAACRRLAVASKARVTIIRPTPKNETWDYWGLCDWTGGTRKRPLGPFEINLTVRQCFKGEWMERASLPYLLETIAHEIAHCHAGWKADHGEKFYREYARMILLSEKLKIRRDILKCGVKIPE